MPQILSTLVQNPERFTHFPGLYTEDRGTLNGEPSTHPFTAAEIVGIDLKFIFNVVRSLPRFPAELYTDWPLIVLHGLRVR